MRIDLAYGRDGTSIEVPEANLVAVVEPAWPGPLPRPREAVAEALARPVDGPPLAAAGPEAPRRAGIARRFRGGLEPRATRRANAHGATRAGGGKAHEAHTAPPEPAAEAAGYARFAAAADGVN